MITMAKFNEYVKDFADDTTRKVLDKIIEVDAIDTGRLFESVDARIGGAARSYRGGDSDTIEQAIEVKADWIDEGLHVSVVGQMEGEEGERLVIFEN